MESFQIAGLLLHLIGSPVTADHQIPLGDISAVPHSAGIPGPTSNSVTGSTRADFAVSTPRQHLDIGHAVVRDTRWVEGGVIGAVVLAVATNRLVHSLEGFDDSNKEPEYVLIALGSGFAGFVIGSLIGGSIDK
jgi:hypothetical protein